MPSANEKRHLRIAQERVDQEEAVAAERRRRQREKVRQAGTRTRELLRKLVDWRTGAVITILLVGYVRLQIHERSVYCAERNAWHFNYEAWRPKYPDPWWSYDRLIDWQNYPTVCDRETGEPLPWP
jgi:hypothetical protein